MIEYVKPQLRHMRGDGLLHFRPSDYIVTVREHWICIYIVIVNELREYHITQVGFWWKKITPPRKFVGHHHTKSSGTCRRFRSRSHQSKCADGSDHIPSGKQDILFVLDYISGHRHIKMAPSSLTDTMILPDGQIFTRFTAPEWPLPTWVTTPSLYRQTYKRIQSLQSMKKYRACSLERSAITQYTITQQKVSFEMLQILNYEFIRLGNRKCLFGWKHLGGRTPYTPKSDTFSSKFRPQLSVRTFSNLSSPPVTKNDPHGEMSIPFTDPDSDPSKSRIRDPSYTSQ